MKKNQPVIHSCTNGYAKSKGRRRGDHMAAKPVYELSDHSFITPEIASKLNDFTIRHCGFFGYSLFSDGSFYSKCGVELKPKYDTSESGIIRFYVNSKYLPLSVAKMIATAFVPNPDRFDAINFKDYNKRNCAASNLIWAPAQQRKTGIKPLAENQVEQLINGLEPLEDVCHEYMIMRSFLLGEKASILTYFFTHREPLLRRVVTLTKDYADFDHAYELFHEIIEQVERAVQHGRINLTAAAVNPLRRIFYSKLKWAVAEHWRKREYLYSNTYDDSRAVSVNFSDSETFPSHPETQFS